MDGLLLSEAQNGSGNCVDVEGGAKVVIEPVPRAPTFNVVSCFASFVRQVNGLQIQNLI
jgi:hypothetical protein